METKKTTTSSPKENVITLRDIVELFLNNWYWFVASAVVCVAMAWIYLSATPPLYQRTAVMLVKGDSQNSQNDISAMWEVSGGLGGSGVENEVYILRSYQILNDVVQRLHLDVDYSIRDGLRCDNLFGDLPFEVRFLDVYPGFTELAVSIINEKGVRISRLEIDGSTQSYEQAVAFNDTLSTPAGRILVLPHAESIPHYQGKEIRVTRSDLESATNAVMVRVQTSALASQSTLVNIICQDINIARADAILTSILQVYNETIVEDKNRIASNTAVTIRKMAGENASMSVREVRC